MTFVVELYGVEYLAQPLFVDEPGLLSTNSFAVNGMYLAELEIIDQLVFGCTDMDYLEYWDYDQNNASISLPETTPNLDDGSCVTNIIVGCMDPIAANFFPEANINDNECSYYGCTDPFYLEYWNYNPINYSISLLTNVPDIDDGSCASLIVEGCTDVTAFNYNSSANVENNSCVPIIEGCTDETMFNYNAAANTDYDGTLCIEFIYGCMDYLAYNYNPFAKPYRKTRS